MCTETAAGQPLHRSGPFDFDTMQGWGSNRRIRAEVLRYLLVEDDWQVHARGVWLIGVEISGDFDLEGTTLRCPLRLENCYLSSLTPVNFDYSSVSLLTITGCHLAGLRGDTLMVSKYLDLAESTFTSQVYLIDADIAGQFNCSKAQLKAGPDDDRYALFADGIKVRGGVDLDQAITEGGAVRLLGADIGGQLTCTGAQLNGVDKHGLALAADGIRAGGDVYFGQSGYALCEGTKAAGDASPGPQFTAAGAVRLPGADIRGQLSCRGAQLQGADVCGDALRLDGMTVSGDVYLDKEFTAVDTVRLNGSNIAGTLRFGRARLKRPGGDRPALLADGMKVGGDVYLDDGFTAAGTLSLKSVCVEGSLLLMPAKLADCKALDADGAQITHELRWKPTEPVTGLVNLEDAVVGELQDFWSTERPNGFWPRADQGKLRLDGFNYTRIGREQPTEPEHRLVWLGSQLKRSGPRKGFVTRPYEQLAMVYQQNGQDAEARQVAIAQRRDLRWYGDLSPSRKAWNWLFDVTIRYGYQTGRALRWLAAIFALFVVASWVAQHQANLIVPAQNIKDLHPVPTAANCTKSYPCFSPLGYAIDTVIPLINIHQADFWRPNASAPYGWIFEFGTWACTALGWALATLIVAGYTGLVRTNDTP
jgi:hypothetical protein